ncbi:MAG: hypothetical protein K6E38_00015 [Fretibacterium sp.]|nr:hypothetical protein [Fretibacterium sp.]
MKKPANRGPAVQSGVRRHDGSDGEGRGKAKYPWTAPLSLFSEGMGRLFRVDSSAALVNEIKKL